MIPRSSPDEPIPVAGLGKRAALRLSKEPIAIAGQQVVAGIEKKSGRRCRSYETVLPTNAGRLLFILTTDAEQTNVTQAADARPFGLSESQVRQIVESFQARDGMQ